VIKISPDNTEQLGIGSRFLGSGGGDSFLFTQHSFKTQVMRDGIRVVDITSLDDDALVVPLVCLGNDIVLAEKNHNLCHFIKLFKKIENVYGKKIDIVAVLSIGGNTIFSSAFLASHFDIPLLDADCFGRTLPELQMMSTYLAGIPLQKSFISNLMGDVFVIECNNFQALESHARRITISSGGCCTIVPQVLTGEEAKRGLIGGTLTQALTIGQIIQETRDLNAVMEYTQGTLVGVGGVMLIDGYLNNLPPPFKRRLIIKNVEEGRTWEVLMANEFNLLFEDGEVIAEVPDIITLCNPYTCEPLTIRQLTPNANVAICTMKAPAIWYTEKGLALVRTQVHMEAKEALLLQRSSAVRKSA
jgi:DUF917 family protein